ncbi:hypothetical protein D3C87_1149970 [compost metagenome]
MPVRGIDRTERPVNQGFAGIGSNRHKVQFVGIGVLQEPLVNFAGTNWSETAIAKKVKAIFGKEEMSPFNGNHGFRH